MEVVGQPGPANRLGAVRSAGRCSPDRLRASA